MRTTSDIQRETGAISVLHLSRGQLLESERMANRFAIIRQGALKVEYLNPDGRHDVAAFLFAGDPVVAVFAEDPVAVTALEETRLCELDPARMHGATEFFGRIVQELSRIVAVQANNDQRRLLSAHTGTVEERIDWFLHDVAMRQKRSRVELAMSREDIARYLETSPESVSRALSDLSRKGTIVREKPRRIWLIA